MLKLTKYLTKSDLFLALVSLCLIILQVYLDLRIPDYMSEITMLVQTDGSQMADIYSVGGKMVAVAFASLLTAVVIAVIAAKISSNFGANLREVLFDKVQSFSLEEIKRFSTSSLITRTTNDVTQVQILIVMGLQLMLKAPIMGGWAITKIAGKSWQWTAATAVAVVFLMTVVGIAILLATPKFKKLQKLTDQLNSVTRENITGLRVVRAYNAEEYQENKFEAVNQEMTQTNLFTSRVMSFLGPTIQMTMSGLSLAIYWIGAILINQAGLVERVGLFSDMIVFSSYAMQVVMSFMMLIMIFIMVPRANVSAQRILEVIDTEPAITDGTLTTAPTASKGQVEFKSVSFKYPNASEYVIKDISFKANQGDTVAFIGSTGSGKSTLVNLIPRLYEATEGEVLVNNVNVKDYTQEALRNMLSYVSQKAVLFSGTIKENIAYGQNGRGDVSESDVVEAVYTAQANDFVEKLPETYDSRVAQSGTNFSGGQKQRLSIARAIARRPEIFIFDDSFSALDYKTDRALREALAKDCPDATKLIVAQRVGTIRDADKIIVLDEGRIVGDGTHDELMASNEVYREIAYSQLSEEELA
ncbi:ABC transporter ATP-binding protein [Fundicoccus sp. Sow4_H7]|uniref:ABC transporter ATP-binding protein n=1 Tax=Fundicoccus sp. Sow4_H7 TaxID=3438784 RepID=UPI003F8E40C7